MDSIFFYDEEVRIPKFRHCFHWFLPFRSVEVQCLVSDFFRLSDSSVPAMACISYQLTCSSSSSSTSAISSFSQSVRKPSATIVSFFHWCRRIGRESETDTMRCLPSANGRHAGPSLAPQSPTTHHHLSPPICPVAHRSLHARMDPAAIWRPRIGSILSLCTNTHLWFFRLLLVFFTCIDPKQVAVLQLALAADERYPSWHSCVGSVKLIL